MTILDDLNLMNDKLCEPYKPPDEIIKPTRQAMPDIDWSKAPHGAKYHAFTQYGEGKWCNVCPTLTHNASGKAIFWLTDSYECPSPYKLQDGVDWTTTLIKRPIPARQAVVEQRLRAKIARMKLVNEGMCKRIARLEHALATRSVETESVFKRNVSKAVEDALSNLRLMRPSC
jgi:hypothetical protein